MAQFLCGNDLRVIQFISKKPGITGGNLCKEFAQQCDVPHVVAGLRDRGLIKVLRCRHWSKHQYWATKDGLRQLAVRNRNTKTLQR